MTDFEQKTTVQIKLVTIDSTFASIYAFISIRVEIEDEWGLMKKSRVFDETSRTKYNGISIFISKWDIRMNVYCESIFYGLGEVLSRAEVEKIVEDNCFPDFRVYKWYEGTIKGLNAMMQKINENIKAQEDDRKKQHKEDW